MNWFANRPRLILFTAAALLLGPAFATDWKALKPQGYVSDYANALDASSKSALETYAAEVEQSTGAQLAFVTVTTVGDEPIEDVSYTLFRAWGIGQKKEDNGILFLLAIQDRRSRLEVGRGLEGILPDGLDGLLLTEMRPALRSGEYGQALFTAAQSIGTIIAKDKNVTIQAKLPRRRMREPAVQTLPWPLILGALFLLFLFTRGSRGGDSRGGGYRGGGGGGGFLTGMILGNLLSPGRSYGGGGGSWGGFGGGDSGGGGFGGFSGGDSGGGGASSSW